MSIVTVDAFDASKPWQLSEQVSLRDEAFGALAYHHVTRRLVFLKSRALVALVRGLEEFDSAHQAVAELIDEPERARYVEALASLHRSALLRER